MSSTPSGQPLRIGFLATRIHCTDGVSLEIEKWATVLECMRHQCFYLHGRSDRPPEASAVIVEARFCHPEISETNRRCFSGTTRFRRTNIGFPSAIRRVHAELLEVVEDFSLRSAVEEATLYFDIEAAGSNLTLNQAQRLGKGCCGFRSGTNSPSISIVN